MNEPRDVDRRTALKLSLAGAAGIAGLDAPIPGDAAAEEAQTASPSRPNILFLLVDEQRYPTVYESEALKQFRQSYLPTQAALAKKGISFDRHYAASVACVPSRTSLYTGHYPSLHGVASTDGAAKAAEDPEMHWLTPGSVPTIGHYLRAAGYRTYWKGKWHVTEADLKVPGTSQVVTSYDANGFTDPAKEKTYLEADTLQPFGFEGWVGPEPHGSDPLRSGSSVPQGKQGRDPAISAQVVQLIKDLGASDDKRPWFVMASFTNPHDIALWGFFANLMTRQQAMYDFSVPDYVPDEPFDRDLFAKTRTEKLDGKPSCQSSYKDAYGKFMQPSAVRPEYYRLYYKLHADVDKHLGEVMSAWKPRPFSTTPGSSSPPITAICSARTAACSRNGTWPTRKRYACRSSSCRRGKEPHERSRSQPATSISRRPFSVLPASTPRRFARRSRRASPTPCRSSAATSRPSSAASATRERRPSRSTS